MRPFTHVFIIILGIIVMAPGQQAVGQVTTVSDDSRFEQLAFRKAEIAQKMVRLLAFMKQAHLDGVLISKVRNFKWITAGGSNQIVITDDVGPATLLILKNGKKYVISNASEGPRLLNEDLKGLGYEWKPYEWYEEFGEDNARYRLVARLTVGLRIGSDIPWPGTVDISESINRLHFPLTRQEKAKYRWLGRTSAMAVQAVLRRIRPGMSERAIESMVYEELTKRRIQPTVILIGVDDRIWNYRHATPSRAKLKRYAMVNICAERWGLVIAMTRLVHFGPVPAELQKRLEATAYIAALYLHHTRPGRSVREIFEIVTKAYREVGYPDEWRKHHQGGAIGYWEREWLGHPASEAIVQKDMAFAWNPTITGAKVEDTFLVLSNRNEVITTIPGWPTVTVKIGARTYKLPAIWVRPWSSKVRKAEAQGSGGVFLGPSAEDGNADLGDLTVPVYGNDAV